MHRLPLTAGVLLCVAVAMAVGTLVSDHAYASGLFTLRELSTGFQLVFGLEPALRITTGVSLHTDHLVQVYSNDSDDGGAPSAM